VGTTLDAKGLVREWSQQGRCWDLVHGWNNVITNGSRDFIVIGGHLEEVKWRTNDGRGFDQVLPGIAIADVPTKMTAKDDASRTSPGDEVGRKPVWADYAKVQ
jgi:hypothetical protein